jgi:signal transduction histidine kinase
MNSIIHAYEPGDEGELLIRTVHDGSNVHLNCSDNGKGMSAESLAKVFEAYYTTRGGEGGSGLGTRIIYQLVTETLQGQISCSSELGVGTMFTITIPVHISPEGSH